MKLANVSFNEYRGFRYWQYPANGMWVLKWPSGHRSVVLHVPTEKELHLGIDRMLEAGIGKKAS